MAGALAVACFESIPEKALEKAELKRAAEEASLRLGNFDSSAKHLLTVSNSCYLTSGHLREVPS